MQTKSILVLTIGTSVALMLIWRLITLESRVEELEKAMAQRSALLLGSAPSPSPSESSTDRTQLSNIASPSIKPEARDNDLNSGSSGIFNERVGKVETTVDELTKAWNRFAEDEENKRLKEAMPAWGPEQATGPPDTHQAGDIRTAWASLKPDGGMEWLQSDYENPVEIAQIRILENDNPGAVVKITGVINGAEVILWQGSEPRLAPPADQLYNVRGGIRANSVRVYLDTRLVPGWNEIDAVELIGRDGSRQWAKSASASSTYANPRGK